MFQVLEDMFKGAQYVVGFCVSGGRSDDTKGMHTLIHTPHKFQNK